MIGYLYTGGVTGVCIIVPDKDGSGQVFRFRFFSSRVEVKCLCAKDKSFIPIRHKLACKMNEFPETIIQLARILLGDDQESNHSQKRKAEKSINRWGQSFLSAYETKLATKEIKNS